MYPEYKFDKGKNRCFYEYKSKKFGNLTELLNSIGLNLTYHFNYNNELKTANDLYDVLENLLANYKTFNIPEKYRYDYAPIEYDYILKLKEAIINKNLYKPLKHNIEYYKETKIYKKYRHKKLPIKIYNKYFENYYYTIGGLSFQRIDDALGEIYPNSFYYEYECTNIEKKLINAHCHSFENVIIAYFRDPKNFKIKNEHTQYYSKQELTLINNLKEILEK